MGSRVRKPALDVRNPKYDGRFVYVANLTKLLPGDILLTRNVEGDNLTDRAISKAILIGSGGTFDHALICTTPPTFVEAVRHGVSTLSILRCFAHDISNVRVLRHPDFNIASIASEYAQLHTGRDYSTVKAMASIFPRNAAGLVKNSGIFCSALIAKCYADAGATDFRETPAHVTKPVTIERMNGLLDVTPSVFQRIQAPPNIEKMSALDGNRRPTPSAAQTAIHSRYAVALSSYIDEMCALIPELSPERPETFFQILSFMSSAANRRAPTDSGVGKVFLDILGRLDEHAHRLIDSGEINDVLGELIDLDDQEMKRSLDESFKPHPDIDIRQMEELLWATRDQITTRADSLDNLRTKNALRLRSIESWVVVSEPSLLALRRREAVLVEILSRMGRAGECSD